jgi:hypothetical protein
MSPPGDIAPPMGDPAGRPFYLGAAGALARGWLCGVDGIFACEATAKIVTARREGFQTKVAAYDKPERRFIQARSSGRPRLSPLTTVAERRENFLWRLLYVFVYLFEFGIVSV